MHFLPLTKKHREIYDIIHFLFYKQLGRFPNLIECKDLNDRIQWLKLFDQDRAIIACSDKLGVRGHVANRVGSSHLTDLYQVAESFEEIDMQSLPEQFVLKTNHDSGSVRIIRDKSSLNLLELRSLFSGSLRRAYGWSHGEWAYAYIKPRIFAEEFLDPGDGSIPADFKFFVVEGRVRFCRYIYDRHEHAKELNLSRDCVDLATFLNPSYSYGDGDSFRRPDNWDDMVDIAERVSVPFRFVRVDLYCFDSRIVVGEMTFWPMAGLYRGPGVLRCGELADFDRSIFRPCLIAELEAETSRHSLYAEGTYA